jgi:hypothetical protein
VLDLWREDFALRRPNLLTLPRKTLLIDPIFGLAASARLASQGSRILTIPKHQTSCHSSRTESATMPCGILAPMSGRWPPTSLHVSGRRVTFWPGRKISMRCNPTLVVNEQTFISQPAASRSYFQPTSPASCRHHHNGSEIRYIRNGCQRGRTQ